MFTYTIDKIAEDLYDLYVSDDDGYTWEYYYSYETHVQAEDDALCWVQRELTNKWGDCPEDRGVVRY
jgi:hypothetical protein